MPGYKVLLTIKNKWWSDQKELKSFNAARTHRKAVAAKWNDCDTAIMAPRGQILAFEDSLKEQAKLAALLDRCWPSPRVRRKRKTQ